MNILLVDDELNCLECLSEGLKLVNPDYQVLTAENGKIAVTILENHQIDLVVTDLNMPVMDGFELLAYTKSNFPQVPVIVMTAFGTALIEEQVHTSEPFCYLEKPLDLNHFCERVESALVQYAKGYIQGISLVSFVQLVEIEKKTCTLAVKGKSQTGSLSFYKGSLVAADCGEFHGLDAAYCILSWDVVAISITGTRLKSKTPLGESIQSILLESLRRKDERGEREEAGDEMDLSDFLFEENTIQEGTMNVKKLNEVVDGLQQDLGAGLIAADIYSVADSQPLVGINSNPKFCALFNQITEMINKALKNGGLSAVRKHYIIDAEDDKMIVVSLHGNYQMGILVDSRKAQLGLLLNVVLPTAMDKLDEAIKM